MKLRWSTYGWEPVHKKILRNRIDKKWTNWVLALLYYDYVRFLASYKIFLFTETGEA